MVNTTGYLKVGVYNIHGGVGVDGLIDLPRIARVLKVAAPDIIGLNEVDRTDNANGNDAKLASELGPEWKAIFGKTINKPICEYGNAILTRLPVVSSESWLFTNYPNQERRGMVRVTVRRHNWLIHVFCTHLGLREEMRCRHTAEILLIMSRFSDAPRILMGDFNEGRGSDGVDAIAKELVDIWAEYGIGQGKTFSSVAPLRRIDFIWTDKELAATSCYVAGFPEAKTASDHLPVFASLIQPSEPQPILRELTVRLNGKEILSSMGGGALAPEYENATVKKLHPVYKFDLADTPPGEMPLGWSQFQRSVGVTPFGGVALIGVRKLWHQHSEQHLSFHHTLIKSPSSTEFEVSARVKMMSAGGGAWRLGAVTSSSRGASNDYALEVSHNARDLPRLRLMNGERELGSIFLSDFHIDPYDWNNYALALKRESLDNGEPTNSLTLYVNGRHIARARDANAGRNTDDDSTTASIMLTTSGRRDAPCEIYAENIVMRQWKTVREADQASGTGYQITIRSFQPNTSLIKSHYEPSTRWRGFF